MNYGLMNSTDEFSTDFEEQQSILNIIAMEDEEMDYTKNEYREDQIKQDVSLMHRNDEDETSVRIRLENEYRQLTTDEDKVAEEYTELYF